MSEVVTEPQAPPVEAPAESGLPPVTPELRAAFANPQPAAEAPQPANPPQAAPPPQAETPQEVPKAPDYGDFVKTLGYESADALKARLEATKDYDPKALETLRANQRDKHDEAIREMLTTAPEKARDYFALQSLRPDDMAKGSPEDQRALLFEKFKLDNPQFKGRLAEIEFEDEFEQKYALAQSGEADDPATERAKLRFQHALDQAAPAVKAAQEAAKVAALPKPAEAQGLTPEQEQQLATEWNKAVDTALTQPLDYTVQVDGKPVKVAVDANDPGLKEFLQAPEVALGKLVQATAYPEGFGKPADMAGLTALYAKIMRPDASAKAVAEAVKAAIGAHVPLDKLINPAPDAPQPLAGPGDPNRPSPGALAQMRAISTGRA